MAKPKTTTASATPETATPDTTASVTPETVMVAYNSPRGIDFKIGNKIVHINGNAEHLRGKEKGVIPVGRFGYTRISADDWEAVVKTYGSMAIIKNGLMFAEKTKDRAEDRADEQAEIRHGLEPVDTSTTVTQETKLGAE